MEVDCFGPLQVKVGRWHEKRWGFLFNCMMTRAVHIDLLPSLDSDSFLMALWRLDPALPQAVYQESELLSRRRWRHCQVLADQFWRHFVRHYLPTLQTRSKWWNDSENLQSDTVVMVVDPQLPSRTSEQGPPRSRWMYPDC